MFTIQNYRWSDQDTHFGPFLYAPDKYRNLAFVLGSGDDEDHPGCKLRMSAFGHTIIMALPQIIRPWRRKVIVTSWDEETVARLGRNWYWDTHERQYGFSYGDSGSVGNGGFLQIFLGRQTHDSSTTQSWACSTPWNNWRHVRHSVYDLSGVHFATEPKADTRIGKVNRNAWIDRYNGWRTVVDSCPARTFAFTDFDGEELTAKTLIEERQWEFGTGWFTWLSWFKKPIIHRSLDIQFSGETGKRKGSWKGGTIGHSIEMLSGELHESAFKRYCAEHEMTFTQMIYTPIEGGL